MADYLVIESRDPFDSGDNAYALARGLVEAGERVTVFLVQNGVLAARAGARSAGLAALAASGAEVLADDFSLRERGIAASRLVAHVRPAPIDVIVDRLAGGAKTLWQ